jgi:hypothetical protein
VIFDLMLDKPYRSGGNFMVQWDCPGLKTAIHCEGTLNKSKDKDKYWSVEMAIPHQALTMNFNNPLKAGNTWRINFSRVQWLKEKGPEENWVWTPTGRIDMHMPDRWGYLYFVDKKVGTSQDELVYPYNQAIYKLLWAMFYAQQDNYSKQHNYLRATEQFFLTDKELKDLPADARIAVEATQNTYQIAIYETRAGIPTEHFQGYTTLNKAGDILYLYLPYKPNGPVEVKGLMNKVNRIWVVGNGAMLNYKVYNKNYWNSVPGNLYIDVPQQVQDEQITVLAVLLDGPIKLYRGVGQVQDNN